MATAEILRERETDDARPGADTAPLVVDARPDMQTAGAFEDRPTPLLDFTRNDLQLTGPAIRESLSEDARTAGREHSAAIEDVGRKATAARGTMTALGDKQRTERAADTVPEVTLPKEPSQAARPFLMPGDSLLGQLQTVMLAVGQVGMQIGGFKGSAIGAVAAMKGMAEGWAKGDAERVDRDYAQWKASSDRLLAQHRLALDRVRARLEDHKATWDETWSGIDLDLRVAEWGAAQKMAQQRNMEGLLKEFDTHTQRVSEMEYKRDRLNEEVTKWNEDRRGRADAAAAALEERGEARRSREQIAADAEAGRREARAAAASSKEQALSLHQMRGGPWVNRKTGEIADNLTRGEWDAEGGTANFKPITRQQMQTIDVLSAESIPQIDQLKVLGDRILAKYPGQNLAKLLELHARGRLSDSDVREYGQARNAVTMTLSRALGGSSAIRQFIFKSLDEAETPALGDTKQTMNRMAENSRTAVVNFIRSAKGMTPFAMPASKRTVEIVRESDGMIGTATLAPYEPLPTGTKYRY